MYVADRRCWWWR